MLTSVPSAQEIIHHADLPAPGLSEDGLLDLLVGIYDEVDRPKLRKEKNVHDFVTKYADVVNWIKNQRVCKKHFETIKVCMQDRHVLSKKTHWLFPFTISLINFLVVYKPPLFCGC